MKRKFIFPHTMKIYAKRSEGLVLLYEGDCNIQDVETQTPNNILSKYKIVSPYIPKEKIDVDRISYSIDITINGVTKSEGEVLWIKNQKISSISGITLGCSMDVLFRSQGGF